MSSTGTRSNRIRSSQACEQCRAKKIKCDGVKPTCRRCRTSGLDCYYGFARGIKNKRIIQDLTDRVTWYENLLVDNSSAGQGLTVGQGPASEELHTDQHSADHDARLKWHSISLSSTLPQPDSFAVTSHTPSPDDAVSIRASEDCQISWKPTRLWTQKSKALYAATLPPRDILEHWLRNFLNSSATFFSSLDKNRVETLLSKVYVADERPVSSSALCQLCAAAAVGCCYDGQEDLSIQTAFIEIVKRDLEDCIEESPTAAIHVMVLLCTYFSFEKRIAALLYAETGLRLVKLCHQEVPSEDSIASASNSVYVGLVFFACWLSATLGHLEVSQSLDLQSTVLAIGAQHQHFDDLYRHEIFKIAMMSNAMLQNIHQNRFTSITTITIYKNRLQQWLLELPNSMRLDYLLDPDYDTARGEPIFAIHILYMSTMILMYQRSIAKLLNIHQADYAKASLQQAMEFFEPCLWATRQIAKILGLVHDQGRILRRCWVTIVAAHSASCVLLCFVVNSLLHEAVTDSVAQDLTACRRCLSVLEHCARSDGNASHFYGQSAPIHSTLAQLFGDMRTHFISETVRPLLFDLATRAVRLLNRPFHDELKNTVSLLQRDEITATSSVPLRADFDPSRSGVEGALAVVPDPEAPTVLQTNWNTTQQGIKMDDLSGPTGTQADDTGEQFTPSSKADAGSPATRVNRSKGKRREDF